MNAGQDVRSVKAVVLLAAVVSCCAFSWLSCGRGKVELDEDFRKVLTYRFGESREPLTVIQDRIRDSYGDPVERLNLERQLVQLLRSESTWECKDFACRQLRLIGTGESIPALAEMLTDEKTSDMARYALELNPDPKVDKALRKALKKARGKALVGIINTLGERRDRESLDALRKLASGADEEVAAAARDAVAKISKEGGRT